MGLFSGIKFNRQEFSGSFGDIGTDFPLIVAMIIAAGLHTPSVLIIFGLMQIITGIVYKMPMPVQPLKGIAAIVIAQQISNHILLGAGLAIGIIMFLLAFTNVLTKITEIIPKAVIRGIQLGLGLNLVLLALKKYIPNHGIEGYILALIAFAIIILLIDRKKYPASIIVLVLGAIFTIFNGNSNFQFQTVLGFNLPKIHMPTLDDIYKGFLLLALPQIPLSIGNSIIATKQVSNDLFPEKSQITINKIGMTFSLMNLFIPFVSGIPSCHGSGGLVGHYTFGGRTGGSVIIYGLFYLTLGLFFSGGFDYIIKIFPLPILGVILMFEGLSLMIFIKDIVNEPKGFVIALLVGTIAAGLPYGFVIAIFIGTFLYYYNPIELKTFIQIGSNKNIKR